MPVAKTGVAVLAILVSTTVRIGIGDDNAGALTEVAWVVVSGVAAGREVGDSVGEGRGVLVEMDVIDRVADEITRGVGVVFGVMITMWVGGEQAVNRKTAIAVMMIDFRMCLFAQ